MLKCNPMSLSTPTVDWQKAMVGSEGGNNESESIMSISSQRASSESLDIHQASITEMR